MRASPSVARSKAASMVVGLSIESPVASGLPSGATCITRVAFAGIS
jgi:hypothetical protein